MEPRIYKPGAYKSPGVYKGTGGIYKGCGVYKHGKTQETIIHIGQNDYDVVEINGLLWITKNLHERLDGVEVIYPNSNPINEEKNGLLYTAYDMFNYVVSILPNGWRIPTKDDFFTLSEEDDSRQWSFYLGDDLGGLNTNGLNVRMNGWRSNNGSYGFFGQSIGMWTSTERTSTATFTIEGNGTTIIKNSSNYSGAGSMTYQATAAEAIRVCKDA